MHAARFNSQYSLFVSISQFCVCFSFTAVAIEVFLKCCISSFAGMNQSIHLIKAVEVFFSKLTNYILA